MRINFKKNKIFFGCIFFFLTSNLSIGAHTEYLEQLSEEGLPIINASSEKDILPGGFRMVKVITLPEYTTLNLEGLEETKMSGSSQFSQLGLDAIIKRIGKKHITLVNLRQEDGGFIEPVKGEGDIAFSYLMPIPWWTGDDPRGSRTVSEIEASEELKMASITKNATFTVYGTDNSKTPEDQHKILYKIDLVVKRALTEKTVAKEKSLGYIRIPDKKFGHMEYEQIDSFIAFVKSLPEEEWLHFHCRKGETRTTLYMILYDMLKNADKVEAADIIKRQGPLGLGGVDFFAFPDKLDWNYKFKKERLELLFHFHTYVKENGKDGFQKSWSEWALEKGIHQPAPIKLENHYKQTTVQSSLPSEGDTYRRKVLVLNTLDETKLRVQNFRSSQDYWLDDSVTFAKNGLDKLLVSGSSQYTKNGLSLLLEKLKKRASKVVIVDLRPDDHIFVNGLNVCSFETKDVLLKAKSVEQIKQSKTALKLLIKAQKGIELHAIDTKYPRSTFDERLTLVLTPKTVETPEELVKSLGAEYLLIGNNRFSDISDENVDQFISYFCKMPEDTWYHFHCKKGKSRTTLFMTILDLMVNADILSLEEIMHRQKLMGGSDLLDVTPKDAGWQNEKAFKKDWIVFLKRFHKYAKENKASHFAKTWSNWSSENADYKPNIDHLAIDKSLPLKKP